MARNSRGGYDSGNTPMDPSKMPKVPTGPAPGAMPKRGGYSGSLPADQVPPPPSTPSETIRPNRTGRKSGKTFAQEIAQESHDVFGQAANTAFEVCPSCIKGDHVHRDSLRYAVRKGATYICLCPECVTVAPKGTDYPQYYGIKAAYEGSWYALAVLREHLKGLGPEQAREGESHTAFALRMVQHQAVKDALAAVEKAFYPVIYVNPAQPDRSYGESDHLTFAEGLQAMRQTPREDWPPLPDPLPAWLRDPNEPQSTTSTDSTDTYIADQHEEQ